MAATNPLSITTILTDLKDLVKLNEQSQLTITNEWLTALQESPETQSVLQHCFKAFGITFENSQEVTLREAPVFPAMPPSYFGNYFDHKRYQQAHCLCALAYSFEKNGNIEEHATKLTVMFKDNKNMLEYLAKFAQSAQLNKTPLHDACLFSLPEFSEAGFLDEREGCHFAIWKELANQKDRMMDRDFKMILPFVWQIEKVVQQGLQEAKQTQFRRDNAAINQKKEDIRVKLKQFNDLERIKGDLDEEQEEEYNRLSKEISSERQALAALLKGKFLKDMSTDEIRAFFEVYKCKQDPAYQIFLDNGIPPKYYEIFESLVCQQDEQKIPPVTIDGAILNYPGCYLKSVNVLDKAQAARAACFGKMTDCCQSISGELGQPCVIHGLTSPNGGFYVVCQGDVNNPQLTDPVLGMSWAWRSQDNAIVFDSVEISKDQREEDDQYRLQLFFSNLAKHLVEEGHTHKVVCGATSGISPSIGNYYLVNPREKFIDYNGYCDSNKQRVIIDSTSPFYAYGSDPNSTEETVKIIKETMQNPTLLSRSETFTRMINFTLLENNLALLNEINDIATKAGRDQELHTFQMNLYNFIEDNYHLASAHKKAFMDGQLSPNLRRRNGLTPLMVAILNNDQELVESLLDKNADINACDLNGDTPLIHAVMSKRFELVQLLVNSGARIDIGNDEGKSAIHVAAQNGDKEIIEFLLSKGADIEDYDINWQTPLISAIQYGNKIAVETLIEADANVNAADSNGMTALHYASGNLLIDCMELLVKHGANINQIDESGHSPLTTFIAKSENHNTRQLLEKIVELGADITVVDDEGNNIALEFAFNCGNFTAMLALVQLLKISHDTLLLHKALEYNVPNIIPILHALGWDINQRNLLGEAPLHLACQSKNMHAIELLLTAHADVNAQDNNGKTALHCLIENNPDWSWEKMDLLLAVEGLNVDLQDSEGQTPFFAAVIQNDVNSINRLIKKGANIEIPNNKGITPLVAAVLDRRKDIVDLLINEGAKLDVKDEMGSNLLDIASRQNDTSMVLSLLNKGFDINHQDSMGLTPLHHAAKLNNLHLVNEFIKRGAKLDIQDNQGNTPLLIAINSLQDACAKALIASGALINIQNKEGKSALHLATHSRMANRIKQLIESGADVNLRDNNGYTALMILEKMRHLGLITFFKKCVVEHESQQAMKENQNENTTNTPKPI